MHIKTPEERQREKEIEQTIEGSHDDYSEGNSN